MTERFTLEWNLQTSPICQIATLTSDSRGPVGDAGFRVYDDVRRDSGIRILKFNVLSVVSLYNFK